MKSVGRVAAPPPQNVAPGDEAGGDRRNAPRSTFYDNILGMPLIGTGDRQPVPNDRPSDRPQARGVAAAPPNAGEDPDHDAILDEALRAAFVPPERLDSGHLVGAATLMAKQGLTPADAYERIVMQSVRDGGLLDDGDFHDAFGIGASSSTICKQCGVSKKASATASRSAPTLW